LTFGLRLGIINGKVKKFNNLKKSVPHIGWNGAVSRCISSSEFTDFVDSQSRYYFVHSYAVTIPNDGGNTNQAHYEDHVHEWAHTLTTYGDETFVSSVSKGLFQFNHSN
jgi:glutamine amidotransferase/cyclase